MAMVDIMGMHGFLWFFAVTSIITFIFIWIFLPETKGKSVEEISRLFEE